MKKLAEVIVFLCLGTWVVYLFLYNLGASPLENWDEAFYADGIRYMARTHNFIIPYWNHLPFFDKPPLYFWLGVMSVSIFGMNEWAYRLPSALAALGTLSLCGWYMYKRYGALPSFVSVLVLISNGVYVYRSRGANLDALATFLIVLSFVVIHLKQRHMPIWYGLCVGLLYMTKASLAFYLLPIFVIHTLNSYVSQTPYSKHSKRHLKSICINISACVISSISLPALWLLGAYLIQGWEYVKYFLVSSDQGTAALSLAYANLAYLRYMREAVGIWFGILVLIGYVSMLRHACVHLTHLMYGWLLFGMLSFSSVHANWYLLPMFPFAAMAAGYSISVLFKKVFTHQRANMKYTAIVCVVLLFSWQHVRIYRRIIVPIFVNHSTSAQRVTGEYARKVTAPDEQLARLDDLYPASIYYSDRMVWIAKIDTVDTTLLHLTRADLITKLQHGKMRVILGKTDEVKSVLQRVGSGEVAFVSGDEAVGVVDK